MTFRLATIAPRLARARDQWEADQRQAREVLAELDRLERRVVHRDLQALRAAASGNRNYTRERYRKLREAQGALERAQRRARRRRR